MSGKFQYQSTIRIKGHGAVEDFLRAEVTHHKNVATGWNQLIEKINEEGSNEQGFKKLYEAPPFEYLLEMSYRKAKGIEIVYRNRDGKIEAHLNGDELLLRCFAVVGNISNNTTLKYAMNEWQKKVDELEENEYHGTSNIIEENISPLGI